MSPGEHGVRVCGWVCMHARVAVTVCGRLSACSRVISVPGGGEDGDRQTGREWAGWLPGRYAGFGSAVSLNELCSGFSCTTRTGVQCRINCKLQHLERSGDYQ